MEFASEMIGKATMLGMRIAEVPITLYPDGRDRAPHLRTWRDGWRHLRLMVIHSPRCSQWAFQGRYTTCLSGAMRAMAICCLPK